MNHDARLRQFFPSPPPTSSSASPSSSPTSSLLLYDKTLRKDWEWRPDDTDYINAIASTLSTTSQPSSSPHESDSIPKKLLKDLTNKIVNSLDGFIVSPTVPPSIIRLLPQIRPSWNVALSPCQSMLAVLQDDGIEIRYKSPGDNHPTHDHRPSSSSHAHNNFQHSFAFSAASKKWLPLTAFDSFPHWRQLSWSNDSQCLAISTSNGYVYLIHAKSCTLLCTILPKNRPTSSAKILPSRPITLEQYRNVGAIDPIAALVFVDPRRGGAKAVKTNNHAYTHELLVITYDGILRGYLFDLHALVIKLGLTVDGKRPSLISSSSGASSSSSLGSNERVDEWSPVTSLSSSSFQPPVPNNTDQPTASNSLTLPLQLFRESPDEYPGFIIFHHKFSFRGYHRFVLGAEIDFNKHVLYVFGKKPQSSQKSDRTNATTTSNLDDSSTPITPLQPTSNTSTSSSSSKAISAWTLLVHRPYYQSHSSSTGTPNTAVSGEGWVMADPASPDDAATSPTISDTSSLLTTATATSTSSSSTTTSSNSMLSHGLSYLYSLTNRGKTSLMTTDADTIHTLARHPNRPLLVSLDFNGTVTLWDTERLETLNCWKREQIYGVEETSSVNSEEETLMESNTGTSKGIGRVSNESSVANRRNVSFVEERENDGSAVNATSTTTKANTPIDPSMIPRATSLQWWGDNTLLIAFEDGSIRLLQVFADGGLHNILVNDKSGRMECFHIPSAYLFSGDVRSFRDLDTTASVTTTLRSGSGYMTRKQYVTVLDMVMIPGEKVYVLEMDIWDGGRRRKPPVDRVVQYRNGVLVNGSLSGSGDDEIGRRASFVGTTRSGKHFREEEEFFEGNDKEYYYYYDSQGRLVQERKPFWRRFISSLLSPLYTFTNLFIWHWDENTDVDFWTSSQQQNAQLSTQRVFRLVCLSKTTPLEAIYRKIDDLDYEGALALAQRYALPPQQTDIIYQAQWLDSQVCEATIEDYLGKIHDLRWVLDSVGDRVPRDPAAMRLLLRYGLSLTDGVGVDDVLRSDNDNENKSVSPIELCRYRIRFLKYLDRLETLKEIAKADGYFFPETSLETGLETSLPETTLESGELTMATPDLFVSLFRDFRDKNLLTVATNFANFGKFAALRVIFERHGLELLPYRLDILKCIPETASPLDYEFLLPVIDRVTGKEALVKQVVSRELDWCEREDILKRVKWDHDLAVGVSSNLLSRNIYPASGSIITKWYMDRVLDMDDASGLLENALELAGFGLENGVSGLESLLEVCSTAYEYVYDFLALDLVKSSATSGSNSSTKQSNQSQQQKEQHVSYLRDSALMEMSLRQFMMMSERAIMRLFLDDIDFAKSGSESSSRLVFVVKQFVVPYLNRVQERWDRERTQGRQSHHHHQLSSSMGLFYEWLLEQSTKSGDLQKCLEIFEASKPTIPVEERIIADDFKLIDLILSCAKACESMSFETVQILNRMYACLPELSDEENKTPEILAMEKRMDEFDVCLTACEILVHYDIYFPLKWFIEECRQHVEQQRALMLRMARQAKTDDKAAERRFENEDEWRGLLGHMLELRKLGILDGIPVKDIYAEFVAAVLAAGEFRLARDILQPSDEEQQEGPPLPSSVAEALVLNASKEYFDNADAGDLDYGYMKMARECLQILPVTPTLQREHDLIEATNALAQLGVCVSAKLLAGSSMPNSNVMAPILPIQIRLNGDRVSLLSRALQVQSTLYRNKDYILSVASKLESRQDKRFARLRVLGMMADAALSNNDFFNASRLSVDIVGDIENEDDAFVNEFRTLGYLEEVSRVCLKLVESKEFRDLDMKKKILGWSVKICPSHKISEILKIWNEVEEALLAREAILRSQPDQTKGQDDVADEDDRGKDVNYIPRRPFFRTERDLAKYASQPGAQAFSASDAKRQWKLVEELVKRRSETVLDADSTDDVTLVKLAVDEFEKDAIAALSYLMCLKDITHAQSFFHAIYPSTANAQLAYDALHLLALQYLIGNTNLPLFVNVTKLQPRDIIVAVNTYADVNQKEQSTEKMRALTILLDAADGYVQRAKEQQVGDMFKSIREVVAFDQDKFVNEPDYRNDILCRAMDTLDERRIGTVFTMAEKYQVPKINLILRHVEYLFLSDDVSSTTLDARLAHYSDYFGTHKKETLLMLQRLHGLINGSKHQKLSSFYSLYESGLKHLGKVKQERLDQIETRKTILDFMSREKRFSDFNFKVFVQAIYNHSIAYQDLVGPLLSPSTIDDVEMVLSKALLLRSNLEFLDEKPFKEREPRIATSRDILGPMLLNIALSVMNGINWSHLDNDDVALRYAQVEQLLEKMTTNDILNFVFRFGTSHGQAHSVAIETRLHLIDRCAQIVSSLSDAPIPDQLRMLQQSAHCARDMRQLVDTLWQERLDDGMLRDLETTLVEDKPKKLVAILERAISLGNSPYLIYRTVDCIRGIPEYASMESLDVSLIYASLLRALAVANNQDVASRYHQIHDIVSAVATYPLPEDADKQWLLSINQSNQRALKELASDTDHIDADMRLKLLEILRECFPDQVQDDADNGNLAQVKIDALISQHWNLQPPNLPPFDTPENAFLSIKQLAHTSESLEQYSAIIDTISELSAASSTMYADANVDVAVGCWKEFMGVLKERQQYDLVWGLRLQMDVTLSNKLGEHLVTFSEPIGSNLFDIESIKHGLLSYTSPQLRQQAFERLKALLETTRAPTASPEEQNIGMIIAHDRMLHLLIAILDSPAELVLNPMLSNCIRSTLSAPSPGNETYFDRVMHRLCQSLESQGHGFIATEWSNSYLQVPRDLNVGFGQGLWGIWKSLLAPLDHEVAKSESKSRKRMVLEASYEEVERWLFEKHL